MIDLSELRRSRRSARRGVQGPEREGAEAALVAHVVAVEQIRRACGRGGAVSVYQADDGEPDLERLIGILRALGATVALPILRDDCMTFMTWSPDTPLVEGAFGLSEPGEGAMLQPVDLAVVVAPLVAFDDCCDRVGRGAGYYDRALGPIRNNPARPLLVGVAFEVQRAANVPRREHDVPMDLIVSDLGIRWNPEPGRPTIR